MELPSASPAPASGGAAAPAWLPAVGSHPREPSCSAHSLFPAQEQRTIQNQFGRVLSTLLNTALVFWFTLPAKCCFCPLLRALVIFQMLLANISLALHSHSFPLQLWIP